MKFTEEKLEQAVIELFEAEGYKHLTGDQIHKEMSDVLIRDDLKQYLLTRYSSENITLHEIDVIIRKLDLFPSTALYESNKDIMKIISDGFLLKREDRNLKDLYIQLIDYTDLPSFLEPKPEDLITIAAGKQLHILQTIISIKLLISLKYKALKNEYLMLLFISTVSPWW